MRGWYGGLENPRAWIKADDPRPVKRMAHTPSGNAAADGYTRHARRSVYDAPGSFRSADDADRFDKMMGGYPAPYDD